MDYFSREKLQRLFLEGIISFNYEPLLEKYYSRWIKTGAVVIDVGAHDGLHLEKMLALSGRDGKVVAFEPLPMMYDILKKKFGNDCVLINSALSDHSGVADFIIAEGALQESGLKERIYNNSNQVQPKKIKAKIDKLDNYSTEIAGVSFIKIDVEGGEIDCLRGADEIIKKFRPLISVEYGEPSYSVYGNTKWTLFEFCSAREYTIYDIFLNRLDTREKWGLIVDSICWDYLLVPAEKELSFIKEVIASDFEPPPLPLLLEYSFSNRPSPSVVLGTGFSTPEEWGVWTDGDEAILNVRLVDLIKNGLVMQIVAHGFINELHQCMNAKVLIGNQVIGNMIFLTSSPGIHQFQFNIPADLKLEKKIMVTFRVECPKSPYELGMSDDNRRLGIGLRNIRFFEGAV